MKKRKIPLFILFLFLLISLSFLPKKHTDLGHYSFRFFQNLFQNERAREVFGLEEDAVAVLFDMEESEFL